MAITAWSAKVSSSSICLSVNGRTSVRRTSDHADADLPRWSRGAAKTSDAESAAEVPRFGKFVLRSASMSGIWIVCRSTSLAQRDAAVQRYVTLRSGAGMVPNAPAESKHVTIDANRSMSVSRLTKLAPHSRRSRPAPAGHPSASWLMTRRISLVAVCCSSASLSSRCVPEFLEQPHVLDGDDRLVGEGLQQLYPDVLG